MDINLNDVQALTKLDSTDALGTTDNYHHQFAEGWNLANSWPDNLPINDLHQILILATGGGSATGASLLQSYLFDELRVPLLLNQGYTIPAFVDKHTLVVVVSHSGKTEEILSAYEQALQAGAQIAVITAGGPLLSIAVEKGHPVLLLPGGMMPRIAIGYIFLAILKLLVKLGLVLDKTSEVEETIVLLKQLSGSYGPDVPITNNEAKELALELHGHIPVVYGSLPITDAVALRWKRQIAENSKLMAMYNALPALHHDEVAGWDAPKTYLEDLFFIFLRDSEDSDKIKLRISTSFEILRSREAVVKEIRTIGTSRLARIFSLVYLGDFVSLYLALIRGVDPTPVDVINLVKSRMAKGV